MSWKDNIRSVTPYTPGEQPKVEGELIKLNTNEFPYPPSDAVKKAISETPVDDLRLYPNVTAAPLAKSLAEYYGVSEDEVFVGVGSDDVLSVAFLTCFSSDKPILFPDITYSFYDVWCDVYRIPFKTMPLDENFRIRKEDYYAENGGVVIANPNAPTGIGESVDFIEDIVKHNQNSVVIVDEAYVDFGGETSLELTRRYDNVLVVRTFSKSRAFAGMRIGFAIGSKELIKCMNDVKFSINSYTMNLTAINYGKAILADDAYFKDTVGKVMTTRKWTEERLKELGFTCLPSQTNFIFAAPQRVTGLNEGMAIMPDERTDFGHSAREVFEYLKKKNIYVRYFNKPRINEFLRITIGTDNQMEKMVEMLKKM